MFANKILHYRKMEIKRAENAKEKPKTFSSMVPIYMFSEDMKCWCQLNIKLIKWTYIKIPPSPVGKYLAFGTDPISNHAKLEISLL
jgi:hypothetical protein